MKIESVKVEACPICGEGDFVDRLPFRSETSGFEGTYQECKECGHGTLNPRPTDEEYYKMYYEGAYRSLLESSYPRIRDWCSDHNRAMRAMGILDASKKQGLINATKVLDFGSGLGILSFLVRTNWGAECTLVEPDQLWGQFSKEEGFDVYQDLSLVVDKKFDLILVSHVLEHMTEPYAVMKSLIRLLAPAGTIYVEVPTFGPSLFHPQVFTPRSLQWMMEFLGVRLIANGGLNYQGEPNDAHFIIVGKPLPVEEPTVIFERG